MPKKRICLALQGGGSYGAFTWGVLDTFLEDKRLEIDAISATSAGSVNAVSLAYGMAVDGHKGARVYLDDIWHSIGHLGATYSPIRTNPFEQYLGYNFTAELTYYIFSAFTETFSPYLLNFFNFNPLRAMLLEKIDFEKLRKDSKIKLFLCATNVKTGQLKVFDNQEISIDTVMASACLPHLFQAVKVNEEYYWDGGYLGNPALFPLIYNSQVNDIIIIHTNPIHRDSLPISSPEIWNRVNEVSFNSSLIRELRAIAFVTHLIDDGYIRKKFLDKIRRKNMHAVRSEEVMNQFNLLNKYKWDIDFLEHLHHLGQITAEKWLEKNFDAIGKASTMDLREFL